MKLLRKLRALFQKRRLDREMAEEMRAHVELQAQRNIAAGLSPEEARYAAQRQFGGMEQIGEIAREQRGFVWVENFLQDLRFALRQFAKAPGFTAVAVLSLAFGIGANTGIFSVVNALVFRPLPYDDPARLVWAEEITKAGASSAVPGPHFLAWREQSRSLERIAAISGQRGTLTGAGEPVMLNFGAVSEEFFPLLGVQLLRGRNFSKAEDQPGGEHVVILSHALWQRQFEADPNVVGRSIRLDDTVFTVIGVLPASFRYFQPFELWVPLALDPQREHGNNQISMVGVVGRLGPGMAREQALAELAAISQRENALSPAGNPIFENLTRLVPLQEKLLGGTRRALLVLLGAVGLILLVACTNVASLTLARTAARQRELAMRAALGASRSRLARQLLTECLLLAAGGAAAGLLMAYGLTRTLAALNAVQSMGGVARLNAIAIEPRVLGFTFLVALLAALAVGLLPAFQLSRLSLDSVLKESGRSGVHSARLRIPLTVLEVALAVMLLVGAGLHLRSFAKLLAVDPGFRAENLLTARLSLAPSYADKARRVQFYDQALQRLAALPGVAAVGAISELPLTDFNLSGWLRVENRPRTAAMNEPPVPIGAASPGYFRVMNIPLRAGRVFNEGDTGVAPPVVILSEALARRLFPDADPLGQRLFVPGAGAPWSTIVGIVGDVHHLGLDKEISPAAYLSYAQSGPGQMAFVLRGTVDPLSLATAVRGVVHALDDTLPVFDVLTMEQRLGAAVSTRSFNLLLLGAFALLALILATIGVYSVISCIITQRTHEVGVRMALGAQAADIIHLFIKQGMAPVVGGVAAGLLGAVVLTRVMASQLFGVSATDPLTFGGVALLLAVVALAACWFPARRAAKVDPMTALRCE